jgi:tRNA (cytidine/uridine-2'-O-)-methyltransferase
MLRIALYQPDIPQNVGSIIRLSACFSAELHIIEPCGFPFDDKRLKRVSLDYFDHAAITRHRSWDGFRHWRVSLPAPPRLVLFSTKGAQSLYGFRFEPGDVLLLGQESCGVPDAVHAATDARVFIPISPATRSLNVAQAAAIGISEAARQADLTRIKCAL